MKKILVTASLILLASCTKNPPIVATPVTIVPNCQSIEAALHSQAQDMVEEMWENVWIVDMGLFYSPSLQACIGKYMASRKEWEQADISVFVVKNMKNNEDIYFQKYTGQELKNEYEWQKAYQAQIASLQ